MNSDYSQWVLENFGHIGELKQISVKGSSISYPSQIILPKNGLTKIWVEELIEKLWEDRHGLGEVACFIDFSVNPVCKAAASGKRIKLDELISAGCVIIG